MLVRPRTSDIKIILENVGKVVLGVGAAMLIPLAISLALAEWVPALDFLIGMLACLVFGAVTRLTCRTEETASWMVGMVTVALAWLVSMVMAAIPLFLSGHFGSFLDACFDAMSGLATTGLSLVQDLDHMAFGTNFWRHLIMFLGGQGIVVVVLTFFVSGSSRAIELYLGEGRDEKILPNAISTARFIWVVSLFYLVLGSVILWVTGMKAGLPPAKGLFHAVCVFMAGYDTGGFTPMSQSIIYYHSLWFEVATMLTMVLGMLNFGVHYAAWTGNRRELVKNVEVRTLAVTIFILLACAVAGLAQNGFYPGAEALFRKGFYQIISGHSGTGFMTVYGRHFVTQWGPLAFFATMIAMGLGGSASSTAGGIKAIRVNLSARAVWMEVKRLISPPTSVAAHKYHHIRELTITEKLVRGVLLVTACYIFVYIAGALVLTMFQDYSLAEALFESTSACANVGLTCGITSPAMPALAKVVFIVQMWAGRLEFISVFMLFGFLIALARGK